MSTGRGFPGTIIDSAHRAKIIGVRSGDEHRFTGVWVVVVQNRVFVRSWSDKPTGWYRAFLAESDGTMHLDRDVPVQARRVRGERLLDAIDAAYAEKYHTPASRKWVAGFAEPARRATTLELVSR